MMDKLSAGTAAGPTRRRFTAQQSEFEAIRAFIETTCAAMGRDERQRVILLVEELFTNSVRYGYGGDSDQPVWLTVRVRKEICRVVYEDRAPPYDPFAAASSAATDAPLEERPIGGLGILFLVKLSSTHRYRRRGNRNIIELELPAGTPH